MKFHTIAIGALCALPIFSQLRGADNLLHPILSISSNNGSAANTVLSTWSESLYTNYFTPRWAPRNSGYDFGAAVVAGDSGWSWNSSSPTQIVSTPSGTVFPTTPSYVIRTQAVTALNGDIVNAPYYLQAGSGSSKSFVFNVIAYSQLNKRDNDLDNLAGAYFGSGSSAATRNDAYARRIAIELMDWARWYPDYTLTGKNSASFINTGPSYVLSTDLQLASDHNGLAHEWSDTPLKAFDAIYDSVALTNLSTELGFDVRDYISTNIFFFEGDFFVNRVPVSVAIGSNLSGPYDVLPQVARVLNRPDYIVWMDGYLNATVTQKIRRDGVLEEGLGYSIGYLNANVNAAQNTHDYFLTRPATNDQFIAISNRANVYIGTLKYGQSQWSVAALPNGELPSFGDTPFNKYFTARNNGMSALLPAYGHVSMGAGSGSQGVQVNQNFPGDNNHMRCDTSAFVLWAFNNEYLGNIRYYNGAAGRQFGEQMLAHNSITIDRVNETPYPDADTYGNGDLTLYEPGNNGLAMTEIDGQRGYSGKASRYQRLMLLNTADLSRPYVVDIFRVTGGTNHDYTLHGAILWDQTSQCSFPLVTNSNPYPMLEGSEVWVPPANSGSSFPYYGYWRSVSSNTAPGNFQITYSDSNRTSGRDLKLWMTGDPATPYNVYLGKTPVPDRSGNTETNFINYLNLWRPSALIRRRVTSGPLQDLFVSVIEPFNAGHGTILSVDRLPVTGSNLESCALRITFTDGRVDTYLVNLRNPQVAGANGGSQIMSTADGQYLLNGRVGAHMDHPNGDSRVWTMNATDFQYPGRRLTSPNTYYSGLITGETRKLAGGTNDAFTTVSPLPAGTALRNRFLSLTHGTLSGSGTTGIGELYRIDQVILSNGQYYVCFTNDHYLEITNGTSSVEQVAPLRAFTGSNSFEIALGAFAGQISAIPDQNIPPGGSVGPINFTFGNLGSTSGASLQVLATSGNQTVIPNSNLVLGGSGTNRTLTITPVPGQTGSSLITLSVTDSVWTNSRSFNANVATFVLSTSPSSQFILPGGSAVYTNVLSATNGTGTVTFVVSGLPVGAGASFNPVTLNGAGTNTLTITTPPSISPGTYPLAVSAGSGNSSSTGVVSLIVNTVSAAPGTLVWLGTNNWSNPANWTNLTAGGNGPPGPGNNLLFTNYNAAAASAVTFPGSGVVVPANVNTFADSTVSVSSLTNLANTVNTSPVYQNLGIANGATLSVGANLQVGGHGVYDFGANNTVNMTVTGAGATLLVTNGALVVSQGSGSGGAHDASLDLSGLQNFQMTGTQVKLAVENITRAGGILYLAKTNVLTLMTAGYSNSDGSGSPFSGNPALYLGHNKSAFGSGAQMYLGVSNDIGVDYVTIGRGDANALLEFNPAFVALNPSVSIHGTNSALARIGVYVVGDGSAGQGSSFVATNDFSGGDVNAIVNYLCVGRGRQGANDTSSNAGVLTFNSGSINANALVAGFLYPNGSNSIVAGTVNVNGGTLTVLSNIVLASRPPVGGSGSAQGTLNVDGGSVLATNISGAGGTSIFNLKNGTVDLSGGEIANVTTITIGNGQTALAQLVNAASISSPNPINVASNGRLSGDVFVTAPQLSVNGAISPGGDDVGWLTNSGSITFGAGGQYIFDMADAIGREGTNWDMVAAGALSVQATPGNPFSIQLRSIDSDPNDNNSGAADFGNGSAQRWIIASASGGVSNFSPAKFNVDTSGFANDLAGGYFLVQTNAVGSALLLSFVPNNPPSADDVTFYLPRAGILQIPISTLAPRWTDPDDDPVTLSAVSSSSANGTNNVSTDGVFLYYTNSTGLADTFSYTVADVRTNPPAVYRPGDSVRTATGAIHILPPPAISSIVSSGGTLTFSGSNGAPGGNYYILTVTNLLLPLNQWQPVLTNSFDSLGNFQSVVTPIPNTPHQFYMLQLP